MQQPVFTNIVVFKSIAEEAFSQMTQTVLCEDGEPLGIFSSR